MFLRPQHFQQQDRFLDWNVNFRLEATGPYPWGITELQVDENMAAMGKFAVLRCAGVMPDGTAFSLPDQLPLPPPIDIPADSRDALISLTLPAQQLGAVEFRESEGASAEVRFMVDEEDVADSFSGERVREPIEIGRPNLRFGVTRDQTYGRVCLGLVRVREVQNKRLMFDDRYIPPAQDIRACTRLKGGLTDILGRADQRAKELALRAVEATDGGAETFASFLLLQALNRWGPMLQHLDSLPAVHPERLYEQLVGMAGELATLARPERKAPPFPRYDHENLQLTFDPVLDLLQTMLSYDAPRSAIQLPIELVEPGSYVSVIRDHTLYQYGYFYLAVNTAGNLDQARTMFPNLAKIGPGQNMHAIVHASLPGIPLRHIPTPPSQLRVLPGYVYFELDRGVAEWREFARASALGLHVADPNNMLPDLKLELWCVKRSER
ncbi:type VI secretion system baseplate subunit TssK [Novosphingobium sp.]|uniref:type VI secretion system baseplate subunit TssK n=1 Tax=Novosphingobium sp. TaxID=1874826 RepID=UPI0035246796